jgi:hypothetical protein
VIPLRVRTGEHLLSGGQHTLPHTLSVGQGRLKQTYLVFPLGERADEHKLPGGQHMLPQTLPAGQHVPFTHVSPVSQHAPPHAMPLGQGEHFTNASVLVQISLGLQHATAAHAGP